MIGLALLLISIYIVVRWTSLPADAGIRYGSGLNEIAKSNPMMVPENIVIQDASVKTGSYFSCWHYRDDACAVFTILNFRRSPWRNRSQCVEWSSVIGVIKRRCGYKSAVLVNNLVSLNIQGRSLSRICQRSDSSYGATSNNTGVYALYAKPSPLVDSQTLLILEDGEIDSSKTKQSYDYSSEGYVVQFLGSTETSYAMVSFLAILLVISGSSVLAYGEGLRNYHSIMAWWIGYFFSAIGLTGVCLLAVTLVTHWAYPYL